MDFWKKATKFSAQIQIRGDRSRRPNRVQSHDHFLRGLQLHSSVKDAGQCGDRAHATTRFIDLVTRKNPDQKVKDAGQYGDRAHATTRFIDLVTRKDPDQEFALPVLPTRERPRPLTGAGSLEAHQHNRRCATVGIPDKGERQKYIPGTSMFPPLRQRLIQGSPTKKRLPTQEYKYAVANSNNPYGDASEDDDSFWGQQKCRVTFLTGAKTSLF